MSRTEFIKKYRALSVEDKKLVKAHYIELYKGAIFPETFAEAEQRLLWIKEAE